MFDPTYPPQNAEIESAPLRGQFNGLKDLIDALNVILAAQVDAVNTINHNEPATATANLVGNTCTSVSTFHAAVWVHPAKMASPASRARPLPKPSSMR